MKGVIFDRDGVIVDAERHHKNAWISFGEQVGEAVSEEFFKKTFGKTNQAILEELFGSELTKDKIEEYALLKETFYRNSLEGTISPLPGALELASELRSAGIRLAIGTSAPRENVNAILRAFQAEEQFDAISSDEDYETGKPAPDVFLTAARKIGLEAKDCLVIEDAVHGIEAALAAGCKCLAVATTNPKEKLFQADIICDSLEEVSFKKLEELFSV